MPHLQALVYVSTAAHLLSPEELHRLLDRARARNLQEGVTGVLLYSYGNFMQYLEGGEAGLNRVYDIIKADRLHHGIVELLREPIQAREFSEWSMAFRSLSAYGISHPPHLSQVFETWRGFGERPPTAAYMLLSKFWNKGIAPAHTPKELKSA